MAVRYSCSNKLAIAGVIAFLLIYLTTEKLFVSDIGTVVQ